MFFIHEIRVPSGCEVIVNGNIEGKSPLRVGTYDQVYYVKFSPFFPKIEIQAACREGIYHKITVTLKLEIQRTSIHDILRDAGYSTYRNITCISAEELMRRQNVLESLKASIETYTRNVGFFAMVNSDSYRKELNQCIQTECSRARLSGEVASCEVVPVIPDDQLLAQLAARAGIEETLKGDYPARTYTDKNLGAIVEYLFETIRQTQMVVAEKERAKADAERAKLETQKQLTAIRMDVKIEERKQESRYLAEQVSLQLKDAKNQEELQKKNSEIKENGAALEHAYKTKRLEEEMVLTKKQLEIDKLKDVEQAATRENKRLDMLLELSKERELAKIHAEEKEKTISQAGNLIEKISMIPVPDYKGIHTLITSGIGSNDPKDFVSGLVIDLLSKLSESLESHNVKQKSQGQ